MKKFLISLFVCVVGFINFGYCEDDVVEDLIDVVSEGNDVTVSSSYMNLSLLSSAGSYCIYFEPTTEYNTYLRFWIEGSNYNQNVYLGVMPNTWGCMTTPNNNQIFYVSSNYGDVTFNYKIIEVNELLATALPKMSSYECQNEYNLIPVEDVDINYCVQNDLCPVPSNFSQLFINDIEHESAALINVTIPQEFDWDYSVTSGQFDLSVEGYNVDTDYIEGIIKTQSTKPNNTDFNNIISYLIPLFVPGLVLILFIYFIFKFVKKIF